jgi:hypothetical protein
LSIGRIFMRVAGHAILIVRFRGVCDHELSLFADYGILGLVEHCLGARLMISSYWVNVNVSTPFNELSWVNVLGLLSLIHPLFLLRA